MNEGFDRREEGFETQFRLEGEQRFRATARRNKLLARWAAGLLGITGDDVDAYVMDVIKADFEETGDEDVFRKVRLDFDTKSVEVTDEELRAKMNSFMQEATQEILDGE